MDFIERLFGFSPDAGSGSLEFTYLTIASCAIVALAYRRALVSRAKAFLRNLGYRV